MSVTAQPLEAQLLGQPRFFWQGEEVIPRTKKGVALLSYLAARPEGSRRDALTELLWGAGKDHNLRQELYTLRRLPGAADWLQDGHTVRVHAKSDLHEFDRNLREGRPADAVALWRGAFLEGLKLRGAPAFRDWQAVEEEALRERYREAACAQLVNADGDAEVEEARALAEQLLREDPLDERVYRGLMQLEARQGDTEAALEHFERCRQVFRDELDAEPLDETLSLLAAIEEASASAGARAMLIERAEEVPALPDRLIGRAAVLREVQDYLDGGEQVLVHGFGGVGKTALAATIARRRLDHGRALWLQLGSNGPDTAFNALARALGEGNEMARTPERERARLLKKLVDKHRLALVVLDDAWNAYSLARLREALPAGVPLLVTARQRYPRLRRLPLGGLVRNAALELLGFHAGRPFTDSEVAHELCALLADHPFALRIAGITLREQGLEPTALLVRLKRVPHRLAVPTRFAEEGRESVAALLDVSLAALDDQAFEAFLGFGALFTPSVTPDLLARCLRRATEEVEAALFVLVQHGIAARSAKPGHDLVSYNLHELAHSYARANSFLRKSTVCRAARGLLEAHRQELDFVEAELGNLVGAAEEGSEEDLIAIMRHLTVDGGYFTARGHTASSLRLLKRAAQAATERGDPQTAHDLMGKLGDAHLNLTGDMDKALEAYQMALELARRAGNPSREAVFLSLLGVVRFRQGGDDAEEHLQAAYRLAKRRADLLSLSTVLEQRGYVAGIGGDFKLANRLFRESLETLEPLAQGDCGESAEFDQRRFFALVNLGETEHRLGHFDAAVAIKRRALRIAEKRDNRVWRANVLCDLGEIYHGQGKRAQAQAHFDKALELYRQNRAQADIAWLTSFMAAQGYAFAAA